MAMATDRRDWPPVDLSAPPYRALTDEEHDELLSRLRVKGAAAQVRQRRQTGPSAEPEPV